MAKRNGSSKTAVKTAVKPKTNGHAPLKTAVLLPQPNGGALLSGGAPGNAGGTGRPPSAIRAAMREALDIRISIAAEIADDPKSQAGERLKALELLARYGLGTTNTETDSEGRDVQVSVVRVPRRLADDN